MQGDGNLVEYNGAGVPVWASGTAVSGSRAVMQSDGNFVVYNGSNQPLWTSDTGGQPGAYLRLRDTGQLTRRERGRRSPLGRPGRVGAEREAGSRARR